MSVQRYRVNGKVRYRARVKFHGKEVASRVFNRKMDADAWEEDQVRQLRLGEWIDPKRATVPVRVVAESWLNSRHLVKRRTRETDEGNWSRYIEKQFGDWPLSSVNAAMVSRWLSELMTVHGLEVSTATRALSTLRGIFKHAVEDKRITRNPAMEVKVPNKKSRREGYALTREEVYRLMNACETPYRDIVLVLAFAGLRWGELVGLQVGDLLVTPKPGLRVQRAMLASNGGGQLYESNVKNNQARTVPLVPELVPVVERWKSGKSAEQWLFHAPLGGALREANWKRKVGWNRALKGIGYEKLRVHDLRHTAASLWLAAGADPKVVQRVLGHASASMTLDRYGHLMDANLWNIADKFGDGQQGGTTGAGGGPE